MNHCLFCGLPFQPGKPTAKFCSAKCRVYANRAAKKATTDPPEGFIGTIPTIAENIAAGKPPAPLKNGMFKFGNMDGTYILIGHTPVKEDDIFIWGHWMQTANRVVKGDTIQGVHVSTVFLGLDHGYSWLPGAKPLLFETMIFEGDLDQFQQRYSTWEEAEKGHAEAVQMVLRNKEGEEVLRKTLD
jgi:hypothetical protein